MDPRTLKPYFLLTIDVEDWFQVENLKSCVPFSSWPSCDLRVERNVHRILDLLDSIKPMPQPQNSLNSPQASDARRLAPDARHLTSDFCHLTSDFCPSTFFTLGWIAKRLPHLIREIRNRGHEIASHGCNHHLCSQMKADALKNDLIESKNLLEDITGSPVYGYRAPSFSITDAILETVREAGYLYDSSYNSFSLHGRYGNISLNGGPKHGIALRLSDRFFELPISNLDLFRRPSSQHLSRPSSQPSNLPASQPSNLPAFQPSSLQASQPSCLPASSLRPSPLQPEIRSSDICHLTSGFWHLAPVFPLGGGAYFRLLPLPIFKKGVRTVLKKTGAFLFYMHPWEIDPDQPRPDGLSLPSRLKHYAGLGKTIPKLKNLLRHFAHCRFTTCTDYLSQVSAI